MKITTQSKPVIYFKGARIALLRMACWKMAGTRVLLFALALACVTADDFERSQQLAPGVRIAWTVDKDNNKLKFAMSAENAGWVGFGISEAGGMKGSDIVYFESGSALLTDSWADGHSKPMPDSCQDWTLTAGGAEGGTTWFNAERALDTGDDQVSMPPCRSFGFTFLPI